MKQCNYLADLIIKNEKPVSPKAEQPFRAYLDEKLCRPHLGLIENLAAGKRTPEAHPSSHEALMTEAYVESKRSSCLKRKVGAVIATQAGQVIAAAHNEVPTALEPCLRDPDYGWCARDVVLERSGQRFHHCPGCGEPIRIRDKCIECGATITRFCRRCPSPSCRQDPGLAYECPKCKVKVFEEFLPGRGAEAGKLLDMCRALHAEESAILNLCKTGVTVPPDSVIYTTTFPCNLCANKIVEVGIRKVVYAEPYITEEAVKIFDNRKVELQSFEGVKSTAFFRLYS